MRVKHNRKRAVAFSIYLTILPAEFFYYPKNFDFNLFIMYHKESVRNVISATLNFKEFPESASAVKQLLSLIFSFRNCSGLSEISFVWKPV